MSWWPWGRFTGWGARRQGSEDGAGNFPSPQSVRPTGYLGEVQQIAEDHLKSIAHRWERMDEGLKSSVEKARNSLESAEKRLQELEERHTDMDRRGHLGAVAHWFLIALLFIVEFPLNLVAFQLFGENLVATALVTLGLAVTLLLCARYVGMYLKEPSRTPEQSCGIVIGTVMAFLVVIGVAVLREHVLAQEDIAGDRSITYAFVVIQILIFLVAVCTTYAAHDPLRDQRHRVAKSKHAVNESSNRRSKGFRQAQLEGESLRDRAQKLMAAYEGENLKSRGDGVTNLPDVKIKVPDGLESLEAEAPVSSSQPPSLAVTQTGE